MHTTPDAAEVFRADLKQMLVDRRREILAAIEAHRRSVRADHTHEVCDTIDMSDASTAEEMSFALLEMRATTLTRVDAALARLASGAYGTCAECAASIASSRLRALPFAVRCRDCEERVERASRSSRQSSAFDGRTALLPEVRSL